MRNFNEEMKIIKSEMEEVISILKENNIKYEVYCTNVLKTWITPEYKEVEVDLYFNPGEVHYYEEDDINHEYPIVKAFDEFVKDLNNFIEGV